MIALELYATLGVPHTASQDDVRRAYRRLSKTLRPDAGGSADGWERLAEAYRVLSDPDLRSAYDRTGVPPPRAARAGDVDVRVLEVIGQIVQNVVSGQEDLASTPVLESVLRSLTMTRVKLMQEYDELRRRARRQEVLVARTRRKRRRGRRADNDLLRMVLEGVGREIATQVAHQEDRLALHDRVVAVLREYEYSAELREAVQSMVRVGKGGPSGGFFFTFQQ